MTWGFEMARKDGSLVVHLPGPDEEPLRAAHMFEEALMLIGDELAKRRDKKGKLDGDWAHKTCYEFLSLLVSGGRENLFDDRIDRYGRAKRGKPSSINPFQKGLLAMSAHDPKLIDERERHSLGKRLWYAYRHYVPAPFLLGFLHQTWNRRPREAAAANFIDPEFFVWVCIQRGNQQEPQYRGTYPDEIEQNVRGLKNILPAMIDSDDRKLQFRKRRRQQHGG